MLGGVIKILLTWLDGSAWTVKFGQLRTQVCQALNWAYNKRGTNR